jgi:hypothetical protein
MKRKKGVGVWELLSCLSVVVIGLFLGGVPAWGASDNDVILCEHTNYGGQQLKFTGNTQVPDLRQTQLVTSGGSVNWNDNISSVQVGKNKKIVLYDDINYGGASITLYGSCCTASGQYPGMPSGWNDRVSSFKIMANDQPQSYNSRPPRADEVIIYWDINYCGTINFYSLDSSGVKDNPDLRTNNWNDKISSIRVGSNVILTVFENINYGGASFSEVGPSDIPSLVPSGWNDKISSFKMRKK